MYIHISSVQSFSCVRLFATPWAAACQASLSITNTWSLLTSCPSSQWCYPTISSSEVSLSSCLTFPTSGPFQWVSSSHQVTKVLELQHQSFQWIFRTGFLYIDWFDLLAVQGTLKSLLQHHSSKASILQCSAFFIVLLSHPYLTTAKAIALTRWTSVSKVTCLIFNTLSRFVIAFLARIKLLLISWLPSPSTVIF